MRPRSTGYLHPGTMSAEFSALRRQLPGGGEGAAPDALGPVSILEEVRTHARSGQVNRADATSLEKDVRTALEGLGTRTKASLAAAPVAARDLTDSLHVRISDPSQADTLRQEVDALLDRLAEPCVREAAFQDAWAAFKKTDRPAERCELRLLQLRELAEHAGFDWTRLCNRFDGVLEDRRQVISAIVPTLEAEDGELAGVRERDRIDLCASQIVASKPQRGDYVVWMVVDHPAMPEPWISIGAIDIFAGELWPDGLLKGSGRLPELGPELNVPVELDDERGFRFDVSDVGSAGVLLARVSLTDVPLGDAARRARALLESAIDLSTPDSGWDLYLGELVWSEANGWSGSSLLSPERAAEIDGPLHAAFEPTARNIGTLDTEWIDRYATGDRTSTEAVRDTRFALMTLGRRDPLLTLALGIRPLERLVEAFGGDSSARSSVAGTYLKPIWVRQTLVGELIDSARAAFDWTQFSGGDEHKRIYDTIWPATGPGERIFSPAGFEAAAADLLLLLDDEGVMADRMLRRALRIIREPRIATAHLDELDRRFERLLQRSERQRNSVVHGYLPPPPLVDAAATFLREIGAYAARDIFRYDGGEDADLLPLTDEREAFLRARGELERGGLLIPALFPTEASRSNGT